MTEIEVASSSDPFQLTDAVVSDPNCIHSSLDSVNPTTGAASSAIANVIAGNGLQSASGFDPAHNLYYYVSFVFPAAKPTACNAPLTGDLSFVLNVITLATGNVVAIPLTNNSIGVGEITTTLGYMQTPRILVGAGSPIKYVGVCWSECQVAARTNTAQCYRGLQSRLLLLGQHHHRLGLHAPPAALRHLRRGRDRSDRQPAIYSGVG